MAAECYEPGQGLVAEDEALRLLCKEARPVREWENVPLSDAYGRVLSGSQIATIDVPGADYSAMDGYAVHTQDIASTGISRLPVTQRIPAGKTGITLDPHTCARIFTGAVIPPGADAVIMQEHCKQENDSILIQGPVTMGANIRRAGEDIISGSEILEQGTRLQPQHVALAASVGLSELPVFRRIMVAVFFTGDELSAPGEDLVAGKIYNSNRYLLIGMLQRLGCEIIDLGEIPDDYSATCEALAKAGEVADLVLTSGGVSSGEEDHVKTAVEKLGQLKLWKIAIKPGKPLVFAHLGDTPFIGLPGNPVSVFITFCLYARPFLSLMQGQSYSTPGFIWVQAGFERRRSYNRREYLRARIEIDESGNNVAHLYPHQGSGVLSSIVWAEGLVCIPEHQTVQTGQLVRYVPLSDFFN